MVTKHRERNLPLLVVTGQQRFLTTAGFCGKGHALSIVVLGDTIVRRDTDSQRVPVVPATVDATCATFTAY